MVQIAIFLQSCLKLGYSEACTVHLGRIIGAYKLFFGFFVYFVGFWPVMVHQVCLYLGAQGSWGEWG